MKKQCVYPVDKQTCVISGANAGIGIAATIQTVQEGYHVIPACRHEGRGKKALSEIIKIPIRESVELMIVEMSLQSSIRSFPKAYFSRFDSLDVLIHNAAAFDISQKEPLYTM